MLAGRFATRRPGSVPYGGATTSPTSRKLRRSAHRSVTEFEADIRDWIEHWNENPQPLAWTKTAEEILESLARYLEKSFPAAEEIPRNFY